MWSVLIIAWTNLPPCSRFSSSPSADEETEVQRERATYLLQATQQVRPLNPCCPGEQKQRPGWDLRARQSYFPPLSPMSLANSRTRASCYLGFFQGTRLQRHPLKVSPYDSQHFKDPSVVTGLFALPGRTMQLRGPHIRILGNCSPGLRSPHTLLSELSVCGSSLESWEGCTHTRVLGQCEASLTCACMCVLALLDVTECALGLMGVCLCACVCRSVPPDPTSLHVCDCNISGHESMCVHFGAGACMCPCPHAHPGAHH